MKKTHNKIAILNIINATAMPSFQIFWRTGIFMILLLSSARTMAQGPYPNTGDQTVCINSTQPYGVVFHTGSTYSWTVTPLNGGNGTITPGASENLISVNWTTAGTATLKVVETNSTGCQGDPVSIVINILALPTVTVNSSAICAGTTATITATPGIAGTYNYVWTVPAGVPNPGNVASFTSAIAGTYSVVITNSTGCSSASASGDVTINAAPNLVINNPSICGTGTVDLTAASITQGSTAGLTFTYWTDAAATIPYTTPTAASAGTYYIKGSLAAGCFAIKPVVVTISTAPTLIINNPNSVCGTNTVDLTAPAITAGSTPGLTFTYWTDAAATIPYPTPTNATTGTYYIKATTTGGCYVIKPVVVNTSVAPTVVITNPSATCGTITVDLTAPSITVGSTPGLTFTYWTDAAATVPLNNPNAVTAGTYYIKGSTTGGCFDIKPVVITSNPLPVPLISGPDPVCITSNGTTSTYSTTNVAGHSYSWTVTGGNISSGQNTNAASVSWTASGTGTINLTETITATGCSANVSKSVTINPKPITSPITHN